ncbi:GNAT family N-acetyltransferase [Peribacillus muralis]|uniref:GNAT family N-acetyltransferase n=1 Tax=Peribacillus muralis TaxID=264697 RepID=UPI001F4E292D|nr:GNAT family protein [Peribacillus muralis]MCK1995030.1 GNAT family N-acetyltransferase [Peribacillus muralis]MCK2015599.1 GNAT family N-acetyltransferase [Peribacillus muralis]
MLKPVTLRGHLVCLEPMTLDHVHDLCEAASEDRSTYRYTNVPDGLEETERYIEGALKAHSEGSVLPFVVRHNDTGRIVGTTRFLDLEVFTWPPSWPPGASKGTSPANPPPPTVAEIGSTWYAASAQRTGVNTECKLLMLAHAFDLWQTIRVTLKTDARNVRSRSAIQRLGATFEGVRRAHVPASDGGIRDTAYYSIVASEWPDVHKNLLQKKQQRR